ncbi:alpha/beta hydrolase family protein [Saccharothrix carnea]|uniref:Alpha/beta hydrolase family protein n=1 Tax=Saccharothrix carnea TaxID=1280637 RepID=A0A2P8I362_SACCR|nr:alpha/beta hydrolase [Saccharothrix carnea]PSL52909.1 alpha/beta hydrolase family protein [Saccharothrix carnea]
MAIPEPTSELWLRAKAMGATWPLSNEETAHALADSWRRTGAEYGKAAEHSLNSVNADWPDAAGTVFTGLVRHHLQRAATTGTDMGELARRADVFANEVATAKDAIVKLLDANAERYAGITGIGEDLRRNAFAQQLAGEVNRLVSDAAGRITGGPALGGPPSPPPGGSPQDVHTWWLSLGDGDRSRLVAEDPDLIRNLDGVPATARDLANRNVLERELAALRAERGELAELITRYPDLTSSQDMRMMQLDKQIAALESLRGKTTEQGYYLLGLDTAGDGKAIVAYGNPDEAANVATFVPGVGASLSTIDGELNRATTLADGAGGIKEGRVAVIAWVGYDTPDNIASALSPTYAADAGVALDRFHDGLRVTAHGAHLSAVGHSYGSTTIAHAAQAHSLAADDLVLVSSPGAWTQHVSDLRLDGVNPEDVGSRVHATTAPSDAIDEWSNFEVPKYEPSTQDPDPPTVDPILGRDPTNPLYGARVFESSPGWKNSQGVAPDPHMAPLERDHPAVDEIGEIINGNR